MAQLSTGNRTTIEKLDTMVLNNNYDCLPKKKNYDYKPFQQREFGMALCKIFHVVLVQLKMY